MMLELFVAKSDVRDVEFSIVTGSPMIVVERWALRPTAHSSVRMVICAEAAVADDNTKQVSNADLFIVISRATGRNYGGRPISVVYASAEECQ